MPVRLRLCALVLQPLGRGRGGGQGKPIGATPFVGLSQEGFLAFLTSSTSPHSHFFLGLSESKPC